jgi:prevent-host-death family protein
VKRASISEAKNRLSALLDRVRQGETVIIEDRGVPVARLDAISVRADSAAEGRVARLARLGTVRPPTVPSSAKVLDRPRPRLRDGRSLVELLIAERREGR